MNDCMKISCQKIVKMKNISKILLKNQLFCKIKCGVVCFFTADGGVNS